MTDGKTLEIGGRYRDLIGGQYLDYIRDGTVSEPSTL